MLQPSSRQRERGYFASEDGLRRLRERKSELGCTYETIGKKAKVHFHTVRRLFNPDWGLPVQMSTIQAIAIFLGVRPDDIIAAPQTILLELPSRTNLFGRTNELEQIQEYILNQNCQLLSIIGMGGIGKTALLLEAIEPIKNRFDYIIGQSLQVPIRLIDLLEKWLTFLNSRSQSKTDVPDNLGDRLTQLINLLSNHRCLLVLDGLESITQEGRVGYYRPEYQDYQKLLRLLFQSRHRSCLVITSRENPSEINYIENTQPIRTLQLKGLNVSSDIQQIFAEYGNFFVSDNNEWQQLINYSAGGNPLMLKMIALQIRDMFSRDISQFIRQSLNYSSPTLIQDLLGAQFARLSGLEKEIVYWLSINREPVSLQELQQDIVTLDAQQNLCNSINSLTSCSFIEEVTLNGYTLQPVIMLYVTQRFVNQFVQEFEPERILGLLNSYSLVKAKKPDYIQHIQVNLFVKPILEQLTIRLGGNTQVEIYLNRVREHLINESRVKSSLVTRGYAAANLLRLFRHLETQLNGYNFSRLGFRESDLCNLDLQNVNFNSSHFESCLFSSLRGGILWVVFSHDGNSLAASDVNGNIHIWTVDQDSRNPILVLKCTLTGYDGWIWTIRFSPDNKYLASAGDQHDIHIWDLETQQLVRPLQGHTDSIRSLSFNCNGFLASASDDKTIKIWNLSDLEHLDDLEQRECIHTLVGHEARVRSVSFNPANPNLLATASDDGTVKIWNLDDENSTQTFRGHQGDIRTVCFSPCGELVASAGNDRALRLWSLTTRECRILEEHTDWVRSVDFSNDGNLLLSASEDQSVKLWNTKSGECIKTFDGHKSWVQSVRFSPNKSKFASGSADRTVKLWDINQGCLTTVEGYTNCLFTIAFSPDARILASGYEDSNIRLYDLTTRRWMEPLQGHRDWVRSVTFSSDGNLIASSSGDRTVRVWRVHAETERCEHILRDHTSWIRQVRFTPDNRFLASCSDDQTIKIWDVTSGNNVRTLTGHEGWVRSIAFSPDGQLLASAGGDRTVKLWNTEDIYNSHCIQTLNGHNDWVWSVAFSPNGQMLASAGGDNTVRIWSINECNKWKNSRILRGHNRSVRAVVFSPDGTILASGGVDRYLRLWNTQTWEEIDDLGEQTDWIRSLAFSSQGHLASASQDGTIKIWEDLQRRTSNTIKLPRLYEGMDVRGATGLTQAQIQSLRALGAKVHDE